MTAMVENVYQFHKALGHPTGVWWSRSQLRLDLVEEELKELRDAVEQRNKVEAADAIGDLLYVVLGAAIEWGVPINAVFAEIHRSNMTKAGGEKREDGKSLKPSWYDPPNIRGVLDLYGRLDDAD